MIPLYIKHSADNKIYHPLEKQWIKRSLIIGSLGAIYGLILFILLKIGIFSMVTILVLFAPMLALCLGVNITGFIICLIKVPNKRRK
jgi:hypothetical protein